jgi:Flp pilus assembly protein TadG
MHLIQVVGLMLITMMVSALAIDFGFYFAEQNRLQTAADAAALAAVTELYRSMSLDASDRLKDARYAAMDYVKYNDTDLRLAADDVKFGFINPGNKTYNPAGFTSTGFYPEFVLTSGYNGVYVQVDRTKHGTNLPLKTIMANMFGISSMDTSAFAVALVDQTVHAINNGGVRPIYICEAQVKKAMEDGILDNNIVRVFEDHVEVDGIINLEGCPPPRFGNWGFADFSNGGIADSNPSSLFSNGYSGMVQADNLYSTRAGDIIGTIAPQLDTLIAQKTVFPVALYNNWTQDSGRTQVKVSGFVGFQVTGYQAENLEGQRYSNHYIEGHFSRYVCNNGCQSQMYRSPTISGSVVKLRLAARS